MSPPDCAQSAPLRIDHEIPDGDILAVDAFTNPSKGDLSLRDDGKLIYTPYDDYEGTDTFDYWATDAHGHFMRGTVTVDVFDMI